MTQPRFQCSFLAPRYWSQWAMMLGIGLCTLLPRKASLWLGDRLGSIFRARNHKRRKIAETNLRMCFPELSDYQRQVLMHRHFRLYGRAVIDLGLVWWGTRARLDDLCRVSGERILRNLTRSGKPVLLITPHTVGVDMAGACLSRLAPGVSMMKRATGPLLTWRLWRGRTRFGATLLMRDQGLRPMVKAMRRGRVGYLMPDEDLGDDRSLFVPFFGVSTATLPVVGWLARLTAAAVLPVFIEFGESGQYKVAIHPPLDDFPSGDPHVDAAKVNAVFEAGIREAPEQTLWSLKWFRTRPAGEPSPYS
ncbi:MAG: lipid A biosynthesis acyltransferase [Proteobacteria bacterium]|nr:lipid A biosynthesis acyltransferase [Pseudomonadota bacterium]